MILLNENEIAAQRAKAKWRSRSKKASQESWSPRSNASSTRIVSYPWHTIRAALPYDDICARQCFVRDWAVTDLFGHWQPANAIAEFLPEMKEKIDTRDMLYNAFMAAAFANYAQKKKDVIARQVAMENCASAISFVSHAMRYPSPDQELDKLVATIALLGMYEILFSSAVTKQGSFNAHLNGTIALIQSRLSELCGPRPMRFNLMNLIWVQMMTHCISHGKHCSLPLELRDSWAQRIPHIWEQWRLMYEATELCARWKEELIDSSSVVDPVREILLTSLIQEGRAMNQAFDDWHLILPETWSYTILTTSEVDWPEYLDTLASAPDSPPLVYKFNALQFQFRHCMHWTWKMILNQAMLHSEYLLWTSRQQTGTLDATMLPSTSAAIVELQEQILLCIDHIRSAALHVLAGHNPADPAGGAVSSFSTFSIIFPLSVACYCMQQAPLPEMEVAPRMSWVKRTLGWIGEEMGFSKAFAMRDFDARASGVQLWGGVTTDEGGLSLAS